MTSPRSAVDLIGSSARRLAEALPLRGLGRDLAAAGLALAHAVVLVALAGMVAAPHLAERFLRQEASRFLGRAVSLESLRCNPFLFTLEAKGLRLADSSGEEPMAGFARLEIDLDPAQLLARRVTVRRFVLTDPFLRLERAADGSTNLPVLPDTHESGPDGPFTLDILPAGARFSLREARLTGGRLEFDDALTGNHQVVSGLGFDVDSLESGRPGLRQVLTGRGTVNETSLALTVKADLSGPGARLEAGVELRDVVLRRYAPYLLPLKRPLNLRVAEADLNARLTLPGRSGEGGPARLEAEASAREIALAEGGGATVASARSLRLEGLEADLVGGAVAVARVALDGPSIQVTRDEAGVIGLMALLEPEAVERPREQPGGRPPVTVETVEVTGAGATITDKGLDLSVELRDAGLTVSGLDLATASFRKLVLEAGSDRFERVEASCSGSWAPYGMTGTTRLSGLDLSRPLPMQKRLLPSLGLSGVASCEIGFEVAEADGGVAATLKGDLDVGGLKALAEGQAEPLLTASRVGVRGVVLDGARRAASVGELSLSGGGAFLRRLRDGRFPALAAVTPPPGGESPGVWSVKVDKALLTGFSAAYAEEGAGPLLRVDLEELAVLGASSDPARPVAVSARGKAADKGVFQVSGEARPGVGSAVLEVAATGLPLAELARLAGPLPAAPVSGEGRIKGRLELARGKDGPRISCAGEAALTGLRLAAPGKEPFAAAAALEARGFSLSLPGPGAPPSLTAEAVIVDQPWLGLVLDEEGRPVPPFAMPSAGGAARSFEHWVKRVEVRRGWVEIAPRGYEPAFSVLVSGLDASLSSTGPGRPLGFDVKFLAGHTGRLAASGRAGVASGALLLEAKATLRNLDLGEFSPVSRRYTGFPIQRGMLGLTLDYKVTPEALDLKNNIVATGVQLGPREAGPRGRDIPLDLAVSLLSDSRGVIDLDIPVTGDPARARTDLRDVVSTAVGGAFARVLLAPLAVLRVQGGKGDTAYLPFEPGSARLGEEARKTLAALGEALADRPRMSLEVAGFVDPDAEKQALARALAEHPGRTTGVGGFFSRAEAASAGPAEPSAADWARLARQRQDAVLEFLAAQGRIPQERVFPLAVDPLAPPAAQGQPRSRAEARLRH